MTVGDVSKALNISIRTLHYYDEIGLLKPAIVKGNKHRIYSEEDVKRLQEIVIFKAIGMSLKEIKKVLNDPLYDSQLVMRSQKQMLKLKRSKLDHLIGQIEQLENGTLKTLDLTESEWELSWDEIYGTQGEVQTDVLSTVKDYIDLLKRGGHKKVLDLGCGTGRNTIYMASLGFDVTATDISEKGVKVTQKKARNRGLTVETACHDFRAIPYKDGYFDAVLCSWVAGHGTYDDMVKHAKEMLRVVKKGGMIFVDYPSIKDEHFGKGEEIEKNTFVGGVEGEEMMPHHYTDQKELEHLYQGYNCVIEPYTYYYQYEGVDYPIEAYTVVLSK